MRSGSGHREPTLDHQQYESQPSPLQLNHVFHSTGQDPILDGEAKVQGPAGSKARATGPSRPELTPQNSSSSTEMQRLARIEEQSRNFVERQEKVSRSRGRVLRMRDRLLDGLDTFRHHQRYLQESQHSFMNAIDAASNLPDPTLMRGRIRDLYEATHLDQCVLDNTTKKLHEIEDRLGGLENVLKKREEKLETVARKMQLLAQTSLTDDQIGNLEYDLVSDTSDGSMRTDESSVPVANPISEYFDKKAEVRVMRERLANVEMEYQEARAQRNFEQDQEREQEMSDEEFTQFWNSEIGNTQEELSRALNLFQGAMQACISAGLVPFVGQKPPAVDVLHDDVSPSDAAAVVDPSLITITAGAGNANPAYLASPHSPAFPNTDNATIDRISGWIPAPPGYLINDQTTELQEHSQFPRQSDSLAHQEISLSRERVASWVNETIDYSLPTTQEIEIEERWRASTPRLFQSGEQLEDYGEQHQKAYMQLYLDEVERRTRLEWTDTRACIPPRSISDLYIIKRDHG